MNTHLTKEVVEDILDTLPETCRYKSDYNKISALCHFWLAQKRLDYWFAKEQMVAALKEAEEALASHIYNDAGHKNRDVISTLVTVRSALTSAGAATANLLPECPTCGGHGIIRHEGTLDVVDDCPACQDCRPEGAP